MKELSRAEVEGLIDALNDSAASVRLAALRAIVRLPLGRETWFDVSRHVEALLEAQIEGETPASFTVNEIPYDEVIGAAVFVPTYPVRSILRDRLKSNSLRIGRTAAHALATARDPAAVPLLIYDLSEESETRRVDAAKSLSLISSPSLSSNMQKEVAAAYTNEADHDVRFWLALTLAGLGETREIQEVLNGLRNKELQLRELYGDPHEFIKQLKKRGPFPRKVRDLFQKIAAGLEDFTSEAAMTLSEAQLPEKGFDSGQSPPTRPTDPVLEELAASVIKQIEDAGELNPDLAGKIKPELLAYLPPDLGNRTVTLLFKNAVEHGEMMVPGNDIVTGVYELGSQFTPDVEGLFECYRMSSGMPDAERFYFPLALRRQIAWTASRAEEGQILKTINPAFKSGDEDERKLAAQLIEETALYTHQSYPPIFGGGSGPEDLVPRLQLISDESGGYGGPGGSGPSKGMDDVGGGSEDKASGGGDPESSGSEEVDGYPSESKSAEPEDFDEDRASFAEEAEYPKEAASEPSRDEMAGEFAGEDAAEAALDVPAGAGMPDESSRGESPPLEASLDEAAREEFIEALRKIPLSGRGSVVRSVRKTPAPKVINTGFAARETPDQKLLNTMGLRVGQKYFFWLDRSVVQRETSAEVTPTDIPEEVPEGARLTVAVFGFKDGIQVERGCDIGEVEVGRGRNFHVVTQPAPEATVKSRYAQERLFFPVQMPLKPGKARMRCNIYWKQTLLQSRLIEARIIDAGVPVRDPGQAIKSVLDYTLSQQLDPAHLMHLNEHRLSILLNNNGDGTNSFHLFGGDGQTKLKQDDVRFREGELQNLIDQARGTLRIASWNNQDEWKEGVPYKYKDGKKQLKRLKDDLVNLAKWGYEFYTQVRDRLAGARDLEPDARPGNPVADFERLMLHPGMVQIAMKESPTYVLPAAMIYDYPLDAGAGEFSLCPSFEKAFNQNESLSDLDCFKGNCPSRKDLTTICPSGFWGFRHYLGMPLSVKNGPPVATTIDIKGELNMTVGVATNLELVGTHAAAMKQLRPGMGWNYADTRAKVFEYLKGDPHIVYFYCHGGIVRKAPYLQVGTKDLIQRSNLFAYEIVWDAPRPLVFINGCHTTAVEPQQALEFISPLITYSQSAGVIGTEITIFEELATVFAEEFFRRFYGGESIGEAIRNSRLKLLASGNPLGLVYIPFVISGLKLNYQN